MVNSKLSIVDRLKLAALSKITGVPMVKLWDFMNGKKTFFGLLLIALGKLVLVLPAVLALFGVGPSDVATYVGYLLAFVGLLHKVYKFFYREEPPSGE